MLWSLVLYNSNKKFRPFKTLVRMQSLFALSMLYITSKRGYLLHHVTVLIFLFEQKRSRVQPIIKVLVFLPCWFMEVSCLKLVNKHLTASLLSQMSIDWKIIQDVLYLSSYYTNLNQMFWKLKVAWHSSHKFRIIWNFCHAPFYNKSKNLDQFYLVVIKVF